MDRAHLIAELQGHGLRAEVPMERRQGGAGPADAGMLWIDGVAATVPTSSDYAQASPYVLRAEDDGWGIYRDGRRLASARPLERPRYYDLETAAGTPYWKIALLHLDSLASTVIQTCAYWGNSDQCTFCGIGVTLANGRTIARKTPEMLAEVAVAARDLDGAVDATLTGVYPFVVPLRPTVGSLMERCAAPSPGYTEAIYRRVAPHLAARGLGAHGVAAGCARCQACSAMSLLERSGDRDDRTYLPLVGSG